MIPTLTSEMKRLQGGPFYYSLADDWKAVINGSMGKMKMKMFFAHDDTISSLLNTLHLYDGQHPSFASHIIYEFYKLKGNKYR